MVKFEKSPSIPQEVHIPNEGLASLVLKNVLVSYEMPQQEEIDDHQITAAALAQLVGHSLYPQDNENIEHNATVGSNIEPEAAYTDNERTLQDPEFDLYRGLVDISLVPPAIQLEDYADEPKFPATILSDTEIIIGDRTVTLKGHQLHVFNALLVRRDKWQTSKDISKAGAGIGYWLENKNLNTFTVTMKSLIKKLKPTGTNDIILKVGKRDITYAINPALELHDERAPGSGNKPGSKNGSKKIVRGEATDAQLERDIPIINIAKKYGQHPEALKIIAMYQRGADDKGNFYRHYKSLSHDEQLQLFADIEAGLSVYKMLPSPEKPTKDQEEALIKLAAAYHVAILANSPLVLRSVKNYPRYLYDFEDYTQEGIIGLAKAAMRFDASRKFKFSTLAVRFIRNNVNRFIIDSAIKKNENEVLSVNDPIKRDGISGQIVDVLEDEASNDAALKAMEHSYVVAATEWINQSIDTHNKLILSLYLGLPLEGVADYAKEQFGLDYKLECDRLAKSGKDNAYAVGWLLGIPLKEVKASIDESLLPLAVYARVPDYTKDDN